MILIDTREQRPFPLIGYVSQRATLPTGDYSLVGFEHRVAIERKSHGDMWQCVAGERARFERCLERLAALDRAAVVIECSLTEFAVRPARVQRVTPATAVGSCISWMAQYRVPFIWADNRRYAERVTLRFLLAYAKHCGGANGQTQT